MSRYRHERATLNGCNSSGLNARPEQSGRTRAKLSRMAYYTEHIVRVWSLRETGRTNDPTCYSGDSGSINDEWHTRSMKEHGPLEWRQRGCPQPAGSSHTIIYTRVKRAGKRWAHCRPRPSIWGWNNGQLVPADCAAHLNAAQASVTFGNCQLNLAIDAFGFDSDSAVAVVSERPKSCVYSLKLANIKISI